jgi:hypothetical protein
VVWWWLQVAVALPVMTAASVKASKKKNSKSPGKQRAGSDLITNFANAFDALDS